MSRKSAGGFVALLLAVAAVMPGQAQNPADAAPPDIAAPAQSEATPPAIVLEDAPAKPAAPKRPRPVVSAPAPAEPAALPSIQGRLELTAGPKQTITADEVADGLVYFLPKAGNPKPNPGYFNVNTHSKGFSPSLLVVPAGSTLNFPNRDTVLHNVFSRTPGATFDLGNYGPGQARQQVLTKPGLVIVNCSVHHSMRATVVVMATPHYTRPDKSGRFELTGLPSGAGTLVYWHPRAAATTVQITLPNTSVQKQRLVASKPRNDHAGMK